MARFMSIRPPRSFSGLPKRWPPKLNTSVSLISVLAARLPLLNAASAMNGL
jgi:hypothetical protein